MTACDLPSNPEQLSRIGGKNAIPLPSPPGGGRIVKNANVPISGMGWLAMPQGHQKEPRDAIWAAGERFSTL